MAEIPRAAPLSPWWRNVTILVMIFGFATLSLMTFQTYKHAPPVPDRVQDEAGAVLLTGEEIRQGQGVFLKYGLMEHGSIWGHGAYLGPDYSAAYLHREVEVARDRLATDRFGKRWTELAAEHRFSVAEAVKRSLKTNRYQAATGVLVYTRGESEAYRVQQQEWADYFSRKDAAPGLAPLLIKRADEQRRLTAFFAWAAWVSRANRPDKDYSYTNNFPYEPLVGNTPTTAAYVWSALSLVFLLGGLGLILFLFGKFDYLGWKGEQAAHVHQSPQSQERHLTPSQWATGLYFVVVILLLLGQVLTAGAMAHYRVESGAFYGLELARYLPFNLLRTWHLQLAIFWIATAWVAGGLFLAPMLGGAEPRGQRVGVKILLLALVVVVLGSLGGEALGIQDRIGELWFWLGHQGSEYLDLGRFWQVLLALGLVFWLVLMFRALRPAIRDPQRSTLASMFLLAAAAIPLFYLPAFFYGPGTNFAVIDNWRFWIIHLWVEGFFELFGTVLVAVMFSHLGLVTIRTATRVIYLDAILYLGGGIIGTAHHWYFTGQTPISMALGACFSALEVVPLTLLTLDAWDFIRLRRASCSECGQELAGGQKWTIYFLMAVGVWNFVGAGIFGFLINLPIVSYFEVGTLLTPNHGHAAMFGVFGMLALALLVYCLRAMQSDRVWAGTEKWVRLGFWGLNIGLALMILINLFPAGVLQLVDVVENGYWHARDPSFLMTGTFHKLEWLRIVGDLTFIVVGVLPLTYATLRSFLKRDLRPARP